MPPRRNRDDRVKQDIPDITSASQLLCYAAAGQLELLYRKRGITQGTVARAAGLGQSAATPGPALTTALRNGHLSARQLNGLDEIIGALDPGVDGTGGLSSLALRLSAEQRRDMKGSSLTARIPPSWTMKTVTDVPDDEVGVLIQASALLSEFMTVHKLDMPSAITDIRERYRNEMDLLVQRLILISVAPPTSRTYDAQILLGMLASYAFDLTRDRLEAQLRDSPMSFRVWRAITKLVMLSKDGEQAEGLRSWVAGLLRDAGELRNRSLHAGYSSDLELAVAVPAGWSPSGQDWVAQALWARARRQDATIRERGTAAMGLWERAITADGPGRPGTERDLRDLITEFRDAQARPDAAAGLRWIAATLEHAMDTGQAVCNTWPEVEDPWFGHVQQAADHLDDQDVPAHLLTGTKNLFRHMILQNAGVYRRQAIETVVTSGMNQAVARALGYLLRNEENEAWLRIRAQAALGFMQVHDYQAERDLTDACVQAHRRLEPHATPDDAYPARSQVTELHASLFAVGDCFGVPGAGARAADAREKLRHVLTDLATMEGDRANRLRRPARAAAYLLTVTAQPAAGGKEDLSQELLDKLSQHKDTVTASLSQWALSFRFAPDGSIRPFLASAGGSA
jgi:hypothetical protein